MTKRSCHQTAPSNSDIQVEFHPMAWRTAMVASKPRRGSFCSASRLGRFWRFLAAFQGNGGVPWCWSRSLWRGTPTRRSWSNWRKRWETDIKNWYKMNQISWWLCLCLMCLSTFHPSDRLGSVWFRKGLFIFNSLGLEGWKAAGKKRPAFWKHDSMWRAFIGFPCEVRCSEFVFKFQAFGWKFQLQRLLVLGLL